MTWAEVMYEEAGQWLYGELPPHSHDPVTRGFLKQRHRVNYDRAMRDERERGPMDHMATRVN